MVLVYNELFKINRENPTIVTWVSLVKSLLYRIGFGYYWEQQCVFNESYFLSIFKQRIYDIYLQEWSANVDITSDNRLYKHIKDKFCFEGYLNLSNKCLRNSITKIRLSSHVFMIERGRWNRNIPNVLNRKCISCNTIEDEYHCMVVCPRFTKERKGCLPDILKRRPSMHEFLKFIKDKNEASQIKLGLLAFRILKEYKNNLFDNE